MSDIAASERRLSAALDRMDQLLENQSSKADPSDSQHLNDKLSAAEATIRALQAELDSLRAADRGGQEAPETALTENPSTDAAALIAANVNLIEANRRLIAEAADENGVLDAAVEALEAEVQAIHAARDAEVKQLSEVVTQLERLLGQSASAQAASAPKSGAKKRDEQPSQGLFSGIYGDTPDEEGE